MVSPIDFRPSPIAFSSMLDVVYFDLETQRTANDAGGWDRKRDMGMSVGVTYSTKLGAYRIDRWERGAFIFRSFCKDSPYASGRVNRRRRDHHSAGFGQGRQRG